MRMLRHRLAVHGPEQALVLALTRERAHRAPAEHDAVALGFRDIRYGDRVGWQSRYGCKGTPYGKFPRVLNLDQLVGALPIERIDDTMRAPGLAFAVEDQIGAHARTEDDARHALRRDRLGVERDHRRLVALELQAVDARVGGVDET